MNKAKSILIPYMEVKVCTHWGYGYVMCTFYLIMCLYIGSMLQRFCKPCMHLYLNCIWNKNSTQSLFRDISWCCWWCCKEAP